MLRKFSGFILYLLITVFVVTIYLDQPDILSKWEMVVYDEFFRLKGKSDIPDDVQIVAIDDVSLRFIGKWPWDRNQIAKLVEKISLQKPRVVYLDLPFPDNPYEDSLGYTDSLAKQIKLAGNVILPFRYSAGNYSAEGFTLPEYIRSNAFVNFDNVSKFEEFPSPKANNIYLPTSSLAKAASYLGFAGVSFDPDRHVRSSPMIITYAGEYLPSASFVIAQEYFGVYRDKIKVDVGKTITLGPRIIPIDNESRMNINFNGKTGVFKTVSAQDIYTDTIGKREFSGKIVIVAYTAAGSVDIYSTPVYQAMHVVEITANTVENIIHNHFLQDFHDSHLINLIIIFAVGILSAIILPRISLLYRIITLVIFIFVIANVSFVLFTNFDIVTQMFYPIIMILFFIIGAPAMKSLSEMEAAKSENDEVDYEALITGTPIAGIAAGALKTASNAAHPTNQRQSTRQQSGSVQMTQPVNQSAIQTMPIAASSPGLPSGTNTFGRYEVIEPIGQGAMGTVYKGLDPAIDRPVALKTIRLDNIIDSNEMNELKERLSREAKAAGSLSHPNIVTIYDVGEEQSLQYIAMEFLDGKTLEALLASGYQWDYKTLCKIMIQISEALDFAHERGIIHRDIKPANMMLLNDDRIKVMDFGIARLAQSNITQSGVALGTPNYISPEQLKGQSIDRRSDIFSLGVVLYEMLTNQKPFKGNTISALIYSILHTTPPPPSEINIDVPRIFDKITAKALAKDPDLRFQTAREMANILRKLI